MLEAVHNLSVMFPHQYWSGVIVLLILVCAGWYRLGVTRFMVVAPAPARPRFAVHWHFRPFRHTLMCTIANVAIMGKLESDVDHLAASLAVRIQL